MKVTVAGYPKTGTKTMCQALRILGYRTYDWIEHFWYHSDEWDHIINQKGTVDDFKQMYKDIDAVTDSPSCYFWEEILQAFPDAKVILTTRNEDDWYQSLARQTKSLGSSVLLKSLHTLTLSGWRAFRHRMNDQGNFRGDKCRWPWQKVTVFNKMIMMRIFRQHNLYVLEKVSKDKLLVMDISEGWNPLCKFLGVETPMQSFPHKNKRASVIQEYRTENPIMKRMELELYISVLIIIAAFAIVLCCLYQSVFKTANANF